jgi:uncharacterized protein (DUF427 family)
MKSPGHQKHPEHKVVESKLDKHVTVEINGELVAEADHVVKVDEDGYPSRYYFSPKDVKMDKLSPSETTSQCPFKGTARYFDVRVGGRTVHDAIWTYEQPYDEHQGLKDRLAFYDDKVPGISIR